MLDRREFLGTCVSLLHLANLPKETHTTEFVRLPNGDPLCFTRTTSIVEIGENTWKYKCDHPERFVALVATRFLDKGVVIATRRSTLTSCHITNHLWSDPKGHDRYLQEHKYSVHSSEYSSMSWKLGLSTQLRIVQAASHGIEVDITSVKLAGHYGKCLMIYDGLDAWERYKHITGAWAKQTLVITKEGE